LGSPPPFFRRVSGPFFQPSQNKDAKNNTCRNLYDEHQRSPCNVGTACELLAVCLLERR
jgi:hypothetical protein